jgi:Sap-like sulfolipid-1-addressing protein
MMRPSAGRTRIQGVAAQALPLALAAAFFPLGLVLFTLLIAQEPFIARAVGFLAGAFGMTLVSGLLFVAFIDSTDLGGNGASHHVSAAVDIAIGLLLLAAFAVAGRHSGTPRSSSGLSEKSWLLKLMRSAPAAVALGAVLYAPSPLYLGALKAVADGGLPTSQTVLWVVLLSVIVTSLIEIPVVLLIRNPARGRIVLAGINAWMNRNGTKVGLLALLVAGLFFLVRGIARLT